jgi:DNA-binding response OmpR family regulator
MKSCHPMDRDNTMRILVVDDDSVQLETICRGLFLYGHECIKALHGGQALDILKEPAGKQVEMLLTDYTMPGKNGFEVIQLARRIRPDLPAVLITGLTSAYDNVAVEEMGIPVLQKPFDPELLDRTICKVARDALARTGT